MTSKVHVLCAPPNGSNPGMASVDAAFVGLADQLDAKVTYWRLWDSSEWKHPPEGTIVLSDGEVEDLTSGLTYQLGRDRLREFLDADSLIFWGDFHHMAVYLDQTADVLHRRIAALSREEAESTAQDWLLLRGQSDEVLRRTVTFGTTLSFNTAADYASPYGQLLAQFVSRAAGAWFRDGYSARVAELLRAPNYASCLGSDAAFLTPVPVRDPQGSRLGVFIGRSHIAPEWVARVGRRIMTKTGLVPEWISWGREPAMWPMRARRRLRIAWPELDLSRHPIRVTDRMRHLRSAIEPAEGLPLVPLKQLERQIAACEIVVTDTYHLAVNAWRIGTPAILLVDPPASGGWNVNSGSGVGRDKRHDLYSQLDALDLLLHLGSSTRARDIDRAVEHALNPETNAYIRQRARNIADHARERLLATLAATLR